MSTKNKIKLKRELGLGLFILYGLGNIIGAGIYALIGKVVSESGSAAPLSFMIAAIVAGLSALSYAELASKMPVSAGVSNYLLKAFKVKNLSLISGLSLIVAGSLSSAVLIKSFAGYFNSLFPVNTLILSLVAISGITFLMLKGIRDSAIVAGIFTIIEFGALSLVIFMAMKNIGLNTLAPLSPVNWQVSSVGMASILSGTGLAFYAYIGFEDMVDVAEEVKNPKKNIPIALLGALFAATFFYIIIVGISISVLSVSSLQNSTAPIKDIFSKVSGLNPSIISLAGVIATINGVIVNMVMTSRILYGLSIKKLIPGVFTKLNSKSVPLIATLITALAVLLLSFLGSLSSLAKLTSVMILIIFFLVNTALIKIKFSEPSKFKQKNAFTVHWIIPIIGAGASFSLFIFTLIKVFIPST